MSTVYPVILGFAGYGNGHDAFLHPDDEWDDAHPLVQERPDLFVSAETPADAEPAPKRRGRPPKVRTEEPAPCLTLDCVQEHEHTGPVLQADANG